ncbi:ABC-2 family transporter protein [Brevibacterium sandarakinum]|uniref:ABC-2 family transporter protein n=1 Tax=Brevibacterium sandarakinum TaxID=629680 RepID=A0A1H1XAC9_BRESA|nr:ABC transporter permease [Brevibacterium sandarakinum]SDT06283.1 ABC-2 family transporter protein [Brevibacterium sandarakinum]
MNTRAIANEFAKMRHLRIGLVTAVMILAVLGLSLYTVVSSPTFSPEAPSAWNGLLAGMSLGIPLIFPLLLAVLASRQTDIEHQGNGWLLQATSGLTPGGVCRAKFTALGLVVAASTIGTSLLVLVTGKLLVGIIPPVSFAHWAGFTGCMLVVNLVVLAGHILVSAKVDNQLVALGIGILGTILAVFSQGLPDVVAHLTPWGYYALAMAADYQGTGFVALPLPYPSAAALAVVAVVLFTIITDRFDHQEA